MSMFREVLSRQCGDLPSGMQGHAQSIAWSCEGRLACGSTDGWLIIADIDVHGNARVKSSFLAHSTKDQVEGLDWHPLDKNQLATCSADKVMKVWDARTPGRPVQEHTSDGDNLSLTYSPNGHYIAMGSTRKEKNMDTDILGIYDIRTKKKLKSVKFPFAVFDYKWSPNGEYIIHSSEKGKIDINAFGPTKPLSRVKSTPAAHTAACHGLDIDPFNRYLACGGLDGLVSLWDMENVVCVRTIDCEGGVRSLSFSPDGRFLAISMHEAPVHIAEVETGAPAHSMDAVGLHPESFLSVKFHPKRPILAGVASRSGRGDFGLRLWSFIY